MKYFLLIFMSVSSFAGEPNDLGLLTMNLVQGFERMAEVSPKPKSLLYKAAVNSLSARGENLSIVGQFEALCGNKRIIEFLLPVIESTSSRVFENAVKEGRALSQGLSELAGENCEVLRTDHTIWSMKMMLTFFQVGWNHLNAPHEMSTQLGLTLASISTPSYVKNLGALVALHRRFQKEAEVSASTGIAAMLEAIVFQFEKFIQSGSAVVELKGVSSRAAIQFSLSRGLLKASESLVEIGKEYQPKPPAQPPPVKPPPGPWKSVTQGHQFPWGEIWTNYSGPFGSLDEATTYCNEKNGEVPSVDDYVRLSIYLAALPRKEGGLDFTHFVSDIEFPERTVPGVNGWRANLTNFFWTSTPAPQPEEKDPKRSGLGPYHYFFDRGRWSQTGFAHITTYDANWYSKNYILARCIIRLRATPG